MTEKERNLLYGVVSLILPDNILDQFDIVKLEEEDIARNDGSYQPFKRNVHIYLDEQDNRTAEQLYWSKRDKEELKDKMPAPEERNAFGGNRRGEPARMVRPCKEKQVAWHEDIHENHQGKRGGFAQLLRDFRNQRIG